MAELLSAISHLMYDNNCSELPGTEVTSSPNLPERARKLGKHKDENNPEQEK